MVCFSTPSLLDHTMPTSYAFHAFLHTMIMVYCCVSGDSCSYDSRASQFLELGVSELCSTTFSSGLLTAWKAVERFYAEGFCFLFDNISCVVLVFASLFP